ncbi:hypothetical protein RCL1_004570 [Eukaryota sp. TZLM3-RCL]
MPSDISFRVKIEDVRVENLPVDQSGSDPSPYVTFSFDHVQLPTPCIKRTSNPVFTGWSDSTTITAKSYEQLLTRMLNVEVYDKKTLAKDPIIGFIQLDFHSLALGPKAHCMPLAFAENPAIQCGTIHFSITFEEFENGTMSLTDVKVKIGDLTGFEPRYNIVCKFYVTPKTDSTVDHPTVLSRATCGIVPFKRAVFTSTFRSTSVATFPRALRTLPFANVSLADYVNHVLVCQVYHRTITGFRVLLGIAKFSLDKRVPDGKKQTLSADIVKVDGNKCGAINLALQPENFPIYAQLVDGIRTSPQSCWGRQLASWITKPQGYLGLFDGASKKR